MRIHAEKFLTYSGIVAMLLLTAILVLVFWYLVRLVLVVHGF